MTKNDKQLVLRVDGSSHGYISIGSKNIENHSEEELEILVNTLISKLFKEAEDPRYKTTIIHQLLCMIKPEKQSIISANEINDTVKTSIYYINNLNNK